ncbi:UNVERIFIED_ORG: hypothetical protein ABID57_001320 [Arthrobacter sp. UYEF1]
MPDELVVMIDGLEMFGRPGLGPFSIVKDGLDGWDDGVAMKGGKVDRPQAHGSFTLPRFQESRTITATGIILATNALEQELAGNRISGLLAHGGTGRIQVKKAGRITWADASLDGTSVDPRRGSFKSDYQIQLWCPDPRKFGDLNSEAFGTGAPAGAHHRGNAAAAPVVTVDGPVLGGYTITGPAGELYTVAGDLPSGTVHTIDMNDGLLRVNGSISAGVGKVTTADVFAILPGQKATVSIAAFSGNVSGHVTVLDTYI